MSAPHWPEPARFPDASRARGADLHESAGPEVRVGIRDRGPQLHGTGAFLHGVVEEGERPGAGSIRLVRQAHLGPRLTLLDGALRGAEIVLGGGGVMVDPVGPVECEP